MPIDHVLFDTGFIGVNFVSESYFQEHLCHWHDKAYDSSGNIRLAGDNAVV